jgi:hypothetical protein
LAFWLIPSLALSQTPLDFLAREWVLIKQKINGITMAQAPAEGNADRLVLQKDMRYVKVENGSASQGIWSFCQETRRLMLQDAQTAEVAYLHVRQATGHDLVLQVENDWKTDLTMYLTASR